MKGVALLQTDYELLQSLFHTYESFGRLTGVCNGLNEFRYRKLLTDVNLNKYVESSDENSSFLCFVESGTRMSFVQFVQSLCFIAKKEFRDKGTNTDALQELLKSHFYKFQREEMSLLSSNNDSLDKESSKISGKAHAVVSLQEANERIEMLDKGLCPGQPPQNITINLSTKNVECLRRIFKFYSHHWCYGSVHGKLPVRWTRTTSMCIGGFSQVVSDIGISCISPEAAIVRESDRAKTRCDTRRGGIRRINCRVEHAFNIVRTNQVSERITFFQFISALSMLVLQKARDAGNNTEDSITSWLSTCSSYADSLKQEEANTSIEYHTGKRC